jgi:hypothetical protein
VATTKPESPGFSASTLVTLDWFFEEKPEAIIRDPHNNALEKWGILQIADLNTDRVPEGKSAIRKIDKDTAIGDIRSPGQSGTQYRMTDSHLRGHWNSWMCSPLCHRVPCSLEATKVKLRRISGF